MLSAAGVSSGYLPLVGNSYNTFNGYIRDSTVIKTYSSCVPILSDGGHDIYIQTEEIHINTSLGLQSR